MSRRPLTPDAPPHGEQQPEDFVRRWSRRKSDVGQSGSASSAVDRHQETSGTVAAQETAESAPVLTDADMPALEALTQGADVSPFFSPGVSAELRRLALRKVFHLPAFNVRDGLDDYDDDFTRFAALGETMTADLRHRMEMEAKRRQEREGSETEKETASEPSPAPARDSAEAEAEDPQALATGASDDAEEDHEDRCDDGASSGLRPS